MIFVSCMYDKSSYALSLPVEYRMPCFFFHISVPGVVWLPSFSGSLQCPPKYFSVLHRDVESSFFCGTLTPTPGLENFWTPDSDSGPKIRLRL